MNAETRNRLRAFRENVLAPGARKIAAAPVAEAPADTRPRFVSGPMAGKLKDSYQRGREALGLDGEDAGEWFQEAMQDPAYRDRYTAFENRHKDRLQATRNAENVTREAAQVASAAERLRLDPAKLGSTDWCIRNASLLAALERRANLREQAENLTTELATELPAEVEEPVAE